MELKINDRASIVKSFSTEDVEIFANLSGDLNPIHLSSKYAEQTQFQKPIVHGFLVASVISQIIATELPGPGSIYLYQDLQFHKPVFHNQKILGTVIIVDKKKNKPIYTLNTTIHCFQTGDLILEGKAVIKFEL